MKKLLIIFCALLFASGCSESLEKKVVGKWQEVNNPKGGLIFNGNHTGKAFWPDERNTQQGEEMKWEILKDQKSVSVITPPGPVIFSIKDDTLIAPNGVILKKIN